jgi:hypothetical protein
MGLRSGQPSERGASQQPPLPGSRTDDPDGGGQLTAMAVPVPTCGEAAAAAVLTRPAAWAGGPP